MLVRNRMTHDPVTVTPQDTLATAQQKMTDGRFRRLPVVEHGSLVGIVTDRDVRRHVGVQERTKVVAAMTEHPITVSPLTTIEDAVTLMLKHKIGGLPVLEGGKLVGIITTSDALQALLDVLGASSEDSIRIDLLRTESGPDLADAAKVVSERGGEVLGVGTYRDHASQQPVFYLRVRGIERNTAAAALRDRGYTVLNVP